LRCFGVDHTCVPVEALTAFVSPLGGYWLHLVECEIYVGTFSKDAFSACINLLVGCAENFFTAVSTSMGYHVGESQVQ